MKSAPRGLGIALATPFTLDGQLDLPALARLVQHTEAGGAQFLVALGSTGEAAMLSSAERDLVVQTVRQHAPTLPLLVGTGASATAQACEFTARAAALGADGALVVVPPYVKPTQAGLEAHFRAVAQAAPQLGIVLYNVPSRTGCALLPSTVQSLWSVPNIVAIKESSGDLLQIGRIASELPPGKVLLAGDDGLCLATLAVGGAGLISVAGNVVPHLLRQLVDQGLAAPKAAQRLHARLLPLFEALFVEPNPIPLKAALQLLGLGSAVLRLPLQAAQVATRERLRACLQQLGEGEALVRTVSQNA